MICTLTTPNSVIDLAGFTGRPSETNGLNIQTDITSQQVSYVGGIEGRQFFRSGSYVSASFSSMMTFSSVDEAEFYLASLTSDLIDQTSSTCVFAERTAEGVKQVESINCDGSATADGNLTITLTSSVVTGSPIALTVPILNGDTTSVWCQKIVDALNANIEIRKRFTISASGANVLLTAKRAAANDSTLNLSIQNGTPSPGIVEDTTSTNVTAGVAPTLKNYLTIYDAIAQVGTSHRGATVSLSASITGRTTEPPANLSITGGIFNSYQQGSTVYGYHLFNESGTFTTQKSLAVDYLIVGGGGGGGGVIGGGGGGGGVLAGSTTINPGSYSIVVGLGGNGGTGYPTATENGTNGANSSALGFTSLGGGGGAGVTTPVAGSGGSGGGASGLLSAGGAGSSGQGFDGGDGPVDGNHAAGGGGGAEVGQNATTSTSGAGGNGASSSITGTATFYGGGGGGGHRLNTAGTPGAGGSGGGGSGTNVSQTFTTMDGTNGLGGGGGGGGFNGNNSNRVGGNGGSGVVIIRYII
jgi:hypothetical protein